MFLFIFLISITAFVLINSQREKEIKLTPNNLSLVSLGRKYIHKIVPLVMA